MSGVAVPWLYVLACVMLAATPGPDMALFLRKTLSGGRAHGFAALGGAMTGLLAHTSAAAVGLSAVIAASSRLYDALKIVGALYLLWLAWSALRNGAAPRLEGFARESTNLTRTFATGLLINLTNPKIVLFFVTFPPQFVDAGDPSPARAFFALGVGFVIVTSLVNGLLIGIAARFVAAARAHPRALRLVDFGVAGVMSAFAARLLIARTS